MADSRDEDEELLLPGYVVMEPIQGCRNNVEQERLQRELATCGVVWPARPTATEHSTFSPTTVSATALDYLTYSLVKHR